MSPSDQAELDNQLWKLRMDLRDEYDGQIDRIRQSNEGLETRVTNLEFAVAEQGARISELIQTLRMPVQG